MYIVLHLQEVLSQQNFKLAFVFNDRETVSERKYYEI